MTSSLARPSALRPGDRVAVLCASSPAPPHLLATGLGALVFAGVEPVVNPSAHDTGTMRPYLAGDDMLRAGDLTAALTRPGTAVAVKLGWASVHGPHVVADELDAHYSLASLLRTLMAPERARDLTFPNAITVVPGRASGRTPGGHLCLLKAPLGPDTSLPAERLAPLGVPTVSWANIGHCGHTQAFPVGVAAELDTDAHTLRCLEPPLDPG